MKRALAVSLLALVACSGSPAAAPPWRADYAASQAFSPAQKLLPLGHVVVIVQENRSFTNLFRGYPGADAPKTGVMSNGEVVQLQPVAWNTPDLDHFYSASLTDYDRGKMNGFDIPYSTTSPHAGRLAYSYLRYDLTKPYWSMAWNYTLADRMFATEHGASWTAHLTLIGTTNLTPWTALVDTPSNSPFDCFAPPGTTTARITEWHQYINTGPYPCFTQFRTMADVLDAGGISWKYYASTIQTIGTWWSPFAAVEAVRYGPDWQNVISPPPRILSDIKQGRLADVTWVTPDVKYSDHAGAGDNDEGPSWVSAIVNEIGESKYWHDTAIVVIRDEWGGWYDDAPPPQVDFKGLGLRVGCIFISPYSRRGVVMHTIYEFGSIQRFIEDVFDLPTMGSAADGYSDARSNSILNAFDFSQRPLAFKHIFAPLPPRHFLLERDTGHAPDDE